MANISPFKALRPRPELARQVASRPYDVLNSKRVEFFFQVGILQNEAGIHNTAVFLIDNSAFEYGQAINGII